MDSGLTFVGGLLTIRYSLPFYYQPHHQIMSMEVLD